MATVSASMYNASMKSYRNILKHYKYIYCYFDQLNASSLNLLLISLKIIINF